MIHIHKIKGIKTIVDEHSKEVIKQISPTITIIKFILEHISSSKTSTTIDDFIRNSNNTKIKTTLCLFVNKKALKALNNSSNIEIDIKNIFNNANQFDSKLFSSSKSIILLDIIINIEKQLPNILKSKPNSLEKSNEELKKLFNTSLNNTFDKYKKIIEIIFNYDRFSKKKTQPYNAYSLTEKIGINTCVYCNRQNIHTVIVQDKKKKQLILRAELDHFFSKSDYPFLALSFYNLIPSCKFCNSSLKGKVKFNLSDYAHPYIEKFSHQDLNFSYIPKSSNFKKIDIKLISNNPKIEKNVKLFKLEEIYNICHNKEVVEMIDKMRANNDTYIEILRKNTFTNLNLSQKNAYKYAFGTFVDEDKFHLHPLSKLKHGIAKEFKLI